MLECSHTIQAWCSEESKKWFDLALNRFSRLNLKGFPTEAIRGALARNSKREIGISYGNLQRAYGGNRTAFEGCFLVANVDRKSTRLNSSHLGISYAVFCLKKK